MVATSPYTLTEGPYTRIDIRQVDPPHAVHRVQLGDMASAEIIQLEWTSPRRLVFATEDWTIAAASLDSERATTLLNPSIFKARIYEDYEATRIRPDDPYRSYEMVRPARLLHLVPGEPDTVIVEGVVGSSLRNAVAETVRLNVATGQWRPIDEARILSPATRFVIDRQGRFRLAEDRLNLPFNWRVRPGGAELSGWRELDRLLAADLARPFEAEPADLWNARSLPLGFGRDPGILYYASNAGRATFGIFALDLATGQRTDFAVTSDRLDLADPGNEIAPRAIGRTEQILRSENAAIYYTDFRPAPPGGPLIFDRDSHDLVGVRTHDYAAGAHWVDEQLAAVQAELNATYPDRRALLIDWDQARRRFLVRIESPQDPGRYFLYHRDDGRWVEFFRRTPRLTPDLLHTTRPVEIPAPEGRVITGLLTRPNTPVLNPAPLVILFANGPWTPANQVTAAPPRCSPNTAATCSSCTTRVQPVSAAKRSCAPASAPTSPPRPMSPSPSIGWPNTIPIRSGASPPSASATAPGSPFAPRRSWATASAAWFRSTVSTTSRRSS